MQIDADGCNFDGFSIRYALKALMGCNSKHHMMIVISDGQPSTSIIQGAVKDAAEAVKEAKRRTKIIGIGIDSNMQVLRSFYKDTFIELDNIENLMSTLADTILSEVRSWK